MLSQRKVGIMLGYANVITKTLVNLVYTPMLLLFVGQGDYGVFQTAYSFVFSLSLLSFGFAQAYVRFYTQRATNGDEAGVRKLNGVYLVLYSAVSIAALLFGLGFSASANVIFGNSFTSEEICLAKIVMAIMAANIAITLFNSIFDAYILAHEEFRFQQSRQLLTTLITPLAAYALLLLGMGVIGVAIAQLVVSIALLVLNAHFAIKKLGMRFEIRRFDPTLFRSIATFSAWIFVNQVCDLVNQNVPNVLLGAFVGASAVAVFAVAVQIRNVFMSLSTTMSNVFIPKVNKIVANSNNNEELSCLMTQVGRYQMILFCWIYGGFALLGQFFIEKWAGNEFSDAYLLILMMVLPLALPLTQNIGIEIQRAKNMHRARSIAMLVMATGNIALTVAAAPRLGYWAPAIAYVFSILFGNGIFMNWYYQRRVGLNMRLFWQKCLPVIVISAVILAPCLVVSHFIPVVNWVAFIIWGITYTFLFIMGIWLVILNKEERSSILKHIPHFRPKRSKK